MNSVFSENNVIVPRFFILLIALSIAAIGLACSGQNGIAGDTPTDAYKRLFAAVKSKDSEAIKKQLTKKTIELDFASAKQYGTTVEKRFENGHTATTFSDTLPPIRDERIKDNMGAIEVWNSKDSTWEDLPFIYEDGAWKLAIGEIFANTYRSPGRGRDFREKEAANAVSNPDAPLPSNANSNVRRPTPKGCK